MTYETLFKEFLEKVELYKKLGVNPFSLATGCAVKVDLVSVLYPAIRSMRPELEKLGMKIAPRRDADIFPRTESGFEVFREIYDVNRLNIDHEKLKIKKPERAIVLTQIHQKLADSAESFEKVAKSIYYEIAKTIPGLIIGKGHSIVTSNPNSQFFLFDYIKIYRGTQTGLVVGNNDTIQIIDPTEDPGNYTQTAIAIGNTLNDLYTLGAWRNIKVYPVVDSPDDDLKNKILANIRTYISELNGQVIDVEQPNYRTLLMGATAFAELDKKPPFFFDEIDESMEIIVTRPIGELAIINVYMMSMLDREIAEELKAQTGIDIDRLLDIKKKVIEMMMKPNIYVARIIEERLPGLDEEFDPDMHIAATTDVTGPGIYVIKELSELANATIKIEDVPLISPEISEFATRNYIIPNSTAGTNGAIVIIARSKVIDDIQDDLKKYNIDAIKIGKVVSKGEAKVLAPKELKRYILAKAYLREFEYYES